MASLRNCVYNSFNIKVLNSLVFQRYCAVRNVILGRSKIQEDDEVNGYVFDHTEGLSSAQYYE